MTLKFHTFNITLAVTSDGNSARLVLVNPHGQASTYGAPFTSKDEDDKSAVEIAMREALLLVARQLAAYEKDGSY